MEVSKTRLIKVILRHLGQEIARSWITQQMTRMPQPAALPTYEVAQPQQLQKLDWSIEESQLCMLAV